MRKNVLVFLALSALIACGGASATSSSQTTAAMPKAGDVDGKITWAMAGAHRLDSAKKRDAFRHPKETLEFFGLKDDMHVVELWPGAGAWYTEILGPVLAERGELTITNYSAEGPADSYAVKDSKKLTEKLASAPQVFGKVRVKTVALPDSVNLGVDESADLVLTFRNLHNWVEDKSEMKVISAAFKVLKHGGTFGVVDHRAKPDADPTKAGDTGYLPEAWVIKTVEGAGFKLAAKSEINANPKDTKDHPKGVWNLPPVLTGGDADRAKYEAIGESDRMTLRFIKP